MTPDFFRSHRVNPGCRRCVGAPVGGAYTAGCDWACGNGYDGPVLGTECVFSARDSDRLAISFEVYLAGVVPLDGIRPGARRRRDVISRSFHVTLL
jgi:hypothetical protein